MASPRSSREGNFKLVTSLRVSDLERHPVWEFVLEPNVDDTAVRPVERLPVATLMGKVVGTRVRLANGNHQWGTVCNLDTRNAELNEHFVTLSLEREGRWFHLARYHDFDYPDRGPEAVARFLGLSVDEIFPISYDVREYVEGKPVTLAGTILKEPRVRLTRPGGC